MRPRASKTVGQGCSSPAPLGGSGPASSLAPRGQPGEAHCSVIRENHSKPLCLWGQVRAVGGATTNPRPYGKFPVTAVSARVRPCVAAQSPAAGGRGCVSKGHGGLCSGPLGLSSQATLPWGLAHASPHAGVLQPPGDVDVVSIPMIGGETDAQRG